MYGAIRIIKEIKYIIYNQLVYDMWTAYDCGIKEHPQTVMKNLGYEVIGSVPQSIADCWWFTVKEFIEPLPKYLTKIEYNYDYWHGGCYKTCRYFKENPRCCFGGVNCKNN